MSKKKKGPNYEVPALEKGLDIIEVLADSPIPLSQIEIARRLEKTVSQVFRMITCLEKRGYIYKDPEAGLILLSDDLSKPIDDQLTTLRAQKSTPLIFALPASGSEKSEVDYRVMLKKILGV